MKKILLSCLMMMYVGASLFAQNSFQDKKIRILPQSELTITGDTNINKFACGFDTSCFDEAQKVSYTTKNNQINFKNARLVLRNTNFDCGNRKINKDFHALLQTEKYPEIILDLKKVLLQNNGQAKAQVRIFIAGKQKDYTVPVEIVQGKHQHFKGKLQLNINDFNLEPPKKLFGVIVVKEDIDINFNLTVKN